MKILKNISESLSSDLDELEKNINNMKIGDSVTVKNYKNGDIYKFVKRGDHGTITDFENVNGKNHLASKQHVFGWAKDSLIYADFKPQFSEKESIVESSKLDIIKAHKKAYQDVENYLQKIKDPFEKDVYQYLILKWLSGNNWLGGISDSVFQKQYEKYLSNYSEDEVLDKFDELTDKFDSNDNFVESLKEDSDFERKRNEEIDKLTSERVSKWEKEHNQKIDATTEATIRIRCAKEWDDSHKKLKEDMEDLQIENPEEVGIETLFTDLINEEYNILNSYDSADVTIKDHGEDRFSEIFDYIRDDINIHIGMLQACLEDLNPDNSKEEGQQKAQEILDGEVDLSDQAPVEESTLDESLFDDLSNDFEFARVNWGKLGKETSLDDAIEIYNQQSLNAEPDTWYSKPIYDEEAWHEMIDLVQ